MDRIKKLLFYFLILFTICAWLGKDNYSFLEHTFSKVENTAGESEKENTAVPDSDFSDFSLIPDSGNDLFNFKNPLFQRITLPDSLFSQNLFFSIWQPPKLS